MAGTDDSLFLSAGMVLMSILPALRRTLISGLWLALSLTAQAALAQEMRANIDAVKSGMVYNFVKFTEWPGTGAENAAPLRVCSISSHPLDGRLDQLQDRALGNRRIVVSSRVRPADLGECQVVFLTSGDGNWGPLLRTLAAQPVLTVSDAPGFVQAGGMIGLVEIDNRLRFEINLAAAQHAGLRLSSQMLRLANQVIQ
jgi:hypothetical protein